MNSESGMSVKPILRNSDGNMFAHQSLQTVPGNLWLPASSQNYQSIHDDNSPGNRKSFQSQMNAPVNGRLNKRIYQPRNVKYSDGDLSRNTPFKAMEME